jgi:hypothetical protein
MMFFQSLRRQQGQSVIEFTLAFPLFIFIFFAIVEFSHLFYVKLTLQHALREAGRYMVTGRTKDDADGNSISRPEAVLSVFCNKLTGTGLSCPALGPQFTLTCLDAPCLEPGGGPDQTVMVTANFEKSPFTPLVGNLFAGGKARFQLSTTWRNEPFQ